jgi:hypothetical protein
MTLSGSPLEANYSRAGVLDPLAMPMDWSHPDFKAVLLCESGFGSLATIPVRLRFPTPLELR